MNSVKNADDDDAPPAPQYASNAPTEGTTISTVTSVSSCGSLDRELKELSFKLRFFGRPFASPSLVRRPLAHSFWLGRLPLSILLGSVGGLAGALFVGSWAGALQALYPSAAGGAGADADDGACPSFAFREAADVSWIVVGVAAVAAGCVGGIVMERTGINFSGNPAEDCSALHRTPDVVRTAPILCIVSFLSLAAGGSVGPESALGTMGIAIGTFLGRIVSRGAPERSSDPPAHDSYSLLPDGDDRSSSQRSDDDARFESERTSALLASSGFVAALGGLLPSPGLAVLLVHEVAAVTRGCVSGMGMTIDSFVAHGLSSAPASRDDRHDHVEQAALGGAAAAAAFAVVKALTGDKLDTSLQVPEYTYETWHLAAAAVLGGLSGLLGLFFILLLAIFEQLRKRLSDRFFKKGALRWVGAVLFPVLALSACGYVEKQHPYGVGSDISRLYQLVEYAASLDAANDISDDCAPLIKDPQTMLHAALLKVTLTALSLGFGLVGGIVLPLLFAGLCLAVAVLLAVPSLPVLVVLPCVTVSVCGSFVPLPFFFSFLMVSVLPVDGSVGAPIFVSVLAAYTLNIGLGFIPFALTRKTRKLQEEITMRRNQEYQHDFEDSLPRMS